MARESVIPISLGILLGDLPWRFQWTRTHRTGFLDRLQERLGRYLPHSVHHAVRGNSVAAESIIRALVRWSTRTKCHFFILPTLGSAAQAQLETYLPPDIKCRPMLIRSALDLMNGVDNFHPDAWFDVSADLPSSLNIRQNFSRKLFPVTAVTHGLSKHTMLHDYFLRILLSGPHACDSLIATSRASQMALTNILGYVAGEFNREFGTNLSYQGRIDRIPLCVDTDVLRPRDKAFVRARLGLRKGDFIMLFLGYLSLLKADIIPLIRLWGSIVKENPDRRLLFIIAGTGEPQYRARLESAVQALGVAGHVRFMLDINDETKELLLPAADLFVSPADSVQESFGLTPVEAMSCGVPQVVSDWDGYRDTVVHGETGFLIPTRWMNCFDPPSAGSALGWHFDHACLGQSVAVDLKALKESIQTLIDNEGLRQRMAENSRRRAESHYSMPVVVKQYEALWSELSAIARKLPPCAAFHGSYAQPSYFRFFGHNSSVQLQHSTLLGLTDFGRLVAKEDEPLPLDPQLPKAGLFDQLLLQCALLKLARREEDGPRACNEQTLGDVLGLMAEDRCRNEGYLSRHLMWLMKYGLIGVVDDTAHNSV